MKELTVGDAVQYDSPTVIDNHHWIWQGVVVGVTWKYVSVEWTHSNSPVFEGPIVENEKTHINQYNRLVAAEQGFSLRNKPVVTPQEEQQQQEEAPQLLKFGKGNHKLGKQIHTFTLPSGYTCPGALACMTKADKETGKIVDGKAQTFRCFAASGESRFKNVRALAWHNLELLKACKGALSQFTMANLIQDSLPADATIVRIHVGGDFFSEEYFLAWRLVAADNPHIRFYAYTKSVNFWTRHYGLVQATPNFRLTASEGGKHDSLIAEYGLKTSKVVFSIEEAAALGLELDHDDSHAYDGTESFALLVHGTQPAGSAAGAAVRKLDGVGSYGAK
jgi:hypothetical protein